MNFKKSTPRPLRCTSLHQSSLPDAANEVGVGSLSRSLPRESSLSSPIDTSSEDDSDDLDAGASDGLFSRKDSGEGEEPFGSGSVCSSSRGARGGDDTSACDLSTPEAGRRRQVRARRKSSISQIRQRPKGLPFSSSTTISAIDAIEETLIKDAQASSLPVTPEARRATYLAVLPAAVDEIRRVSYRRTAMLPKTKSFNRVKASLNEEAAPHETDARKEARLAEILKSKLDDTGDELAMDSDAGESRLSSIRPRELLPSLSPTSGEGSSSGRPQGNSHATSSNDNSDDLIFHMQEISPTSSGFGHGGGTAGAGAGVGVGGEASPATSSSQRPLSMHGKRKFCGDAFDQYSSMKRRAVSPSIGSPLNSPPVKGGGIFRIEDLTL